MFLTPLVVHAATARHVTTPTPERYFSTK